MVVPMKDEDGVKDAATRIFPRVTVLPYLREILAFLSTHRPPQYDVLAFDAAVARRFRVTARIVGTVRRFAYPSRRGWRAGRAQTQEHKRHIAAGLADSPVRRRKGGERRW